jgi:hypothetical protein
MNKFEGKVLDRAEPHEKHKFHRYLKTIWSRKPTLEEWAEAYECDPKLSVNQQYYAEYVSAWKSNK